MGSRAADRFARPALIGPFVLALAALLAAACSSRDTGFSEAKARSHVERLAGVIGSRPAGTPPNRAARDYVVGQLEASGFEVRIQDATAERPAFGMSARVSNVIATRAGARRDAIALMAHYDSVPDGPGAADDGLGAAVCLEAGRVLAARPAPVYSLVVILSDGEEFGLMGAAAVLKDPIRARIRAAINFEAIGSGAPVLLFETGASSGALVRAWARHAPLPSGASFMTEIYRLISVGGDRTDLGLFKRAGFAGLDFASVGDGYTYHTPLDTAARLDRRAIRQAGENAVATIAALDGADLSDRGQATTFFDLLGIVAVAYDRRAELVVFALAILGGIVAWAHSVGVLRRVAPTRAILLTLPWGVVGLIAVTAAMYAAAWVVRAAGAEYQPWYAHPGRFSVWLGVSGITAGWLVVQAGRFLPVRARGSAHPAAVWVVVLPAWGALAVLAGRYAPASAFMAEWPLVVAALALLAFPVERRFGMRAASCATAAASLVLWFPSAWLLLHFAVPELDRSPLVTPLFVYPALVLAVGAFIAPPLIALMAPIARDGEWGRVSRAEAAREAAGTRRWFIAAGLLAAAVASFSWCRAAPAYTSRRPLHHVVRYLADVPGGRAEWEAGANEPGTVGQAHWLAGASPLAASLPLLRSPSPPFTYHAPAPPPANAPFTIAASLVRGAEATLALTAVPARAGWAVAFVLPPDVVPLETNLAVTSRGGRFFAIFAAVPPEGVTFRGRFDASDAERLHSIEVVAMAPGLPGADWPRLPSWLPQQTDVWQARSYYVLPIAWVPQAK